MRCHDPSKLKGILNVNKLMETNRNISFHEDHIATSYHITKVERV